MTLYKMDLLVIGVLLYFFFRNKEKLAPVLQNDNPKSEIKTKTFEVENQIAFQKDTPLFNKSFFLPEPLNPAAILSDTPFASFQSPVYDSLPFQSSANQFEQPQVNILPDYGKLDNNLQFMDELEQFPEPQLSFSRFKHYEL
jgi:hypothetical protein